jgi:Spy/CpxP family protein refolding chaperone
MKGIAAAAGLALAGCSHSTASGSAASTPATTPTPPDSSANQTRTEMQAPPATQGPASTQGPAATQGGIASVAPEPGLDQPAADDAASQEVRDHHRHHHHGGVTMFIAMSLDTLGLEPDKQAQVRQIQESLHAQMKPAREAERKVLSALAEGVAAGSVDTASLSTALDQVATSAARVHAASMNALNKLHAALSPAERAAVIEKVRAHWDVWRKVNADEDYGSRAQDTHLARLTQSLHLTPDQVERISAALKSNAPPKADPSAVEAHVDAFSKAFAAETFDARTLNTADAANARLAKPGATRMVRFYEIVTPLLTPEQRTTLAGHLRDRANDTHAVSSNRP